MTTLDRSSFEAWLRSKKPRAIVGERGDCGECPLAEYLRAASGTPHAHVDDEAYSVGGGLSKRMPGWAVSFIRGVDESGECWAGITARRALAILAALPAEESAHAA